MTPIWYIFGLPIFIITSIFTTICTMMLRRERVIRFRGFEYSLVLLLFLSIIVIILVLSDIYPVYDEYVSRWLPVVQLVIVPPLLSVRIHQYAFRVHCQNVIYKGSDYDHFKIMNFAFLFSPYFVLLMVMIYISLILTLYVGTYYLIGDNYLDIMSSLISIFGLVITLLSMIKIVNYRDGYMIRSEFILSCVVLLLMITTLLLYDEYRIIISFSILGTVQLSLLAPVLVSLISNDPNVEDYDVSVFSSAHVPITVSEGLMVKFLDNKEFVDGLEHYLMSIFAEENLQYVIGLVGVRNHRDRANIINNSINLYISDDRLFDIGILDSTRRSIIDNRYKKEYYEFTIMSIEEILTVLLGYTQRWMMTSNFRIIWDNYYEQILLAPDKSFIEWLGW